MVVILFDLRCRDGRRCVEVRGAIDIGNENLYTPHSFTLYSCAFEGDIGRNCAIRRAISYCNSHKLEIKDYISLPNRRAIWQ